MPRIYSSPSGDTGSLLAWQDGSGAYAGKYNPGFEGDRHPLTVRIADNSIAEKAEGVYTDQITGVIKAK